MMSEEVKEPSGLVTASDQQGSDFDSQQQLEADIQTPQNTRATTFLSKESSVTIFGGEQNGGSRELSFISVDEQAHIAAKLATLPEKSPHEGDPLIDSSGHFRHVTPRNVNVLPEQYYPDVDEGATVKKQDGKRTTKGKKISVGKLATPVQEGDTTEAGGQDLDNEQQPGKLKKEPQSDVFSTQIDEEVLEAAKKRQNDLYEPPWMSRDDRMPTMVEVVSEKAEQHFQLGNEQAAEKNYERATQHYNKAINLKPKDIRFYIYRAEAFLHLTDFQSAILNYKRACVLDPENDKFYNRLAFIYYFHGQCLFDQKLFPEALESFSRATEMRPDVIGYHTRSIACLAALQRHGECLALVNKRLEIEQENADLYIMRARLHQLFRNTTLCYYDVKDALAIDPAHPEAKVQMSQLQRRSVELKQQATQLNLVGRHRDALQKISLAIETNPSVADHHVLRGALHRRLGDFNAAIDDYLLALDKTNHNEDSVIYLESQRQLLLTYNDFAVECFTKGYYEEAIILLNKAIKGEKREKGLYINRGDCFFKEGNLQFAMADYLQAQEIDVADTSIKSRVSVVHNEYGVQEFQDKNFREAESRFTLAIQNSPNTAKYYISRCRTRQMMENLAAARQDILLALLLEPANLELMPIVTRLFPGKSIKDVLHSKAAFQARKALEELIIAAAPFKMKGLDMTMERMSPVVPIAEGSDVGDVASGGGPQHLSSFPVTATQGRVGHLPDLRSCMEEQEFHVKIAVEKHKLNQKVKDVLQNRNSLRRTVGQICPLPEAKPHAQKGGSLFTNTELAGAKVQVKQTSGWRNFGLGVGVPE